MILAIDIGNTNIVIGCCADGQVIFRERVSTNPTATVLEYAVWQVLLRWCRCTPVRYLSGRADP